MLGKVRSGTSFSGYTSAFPAGVYFTPANLVRASVLLHRPLFPLCRPVVAGATLRRFPVGPRQGISPRFRNSLREDQVMNGLVPIHPEQFCASTSRTVGGLQLTQT